MLLNHPAQLASDRRYFLFCLAHLVSGRTDAILHQPVCDESVEEVICEGEKVIGIDRKVHERMDISQFPAEPLQCVPGLVQVGRRIIHLAVFHHGRQEPAAQHLAFLQTGFRLYSSLTSIIQLEGGNQTANA